MADKFVQIKDGADNSLYPNINASPFDSRWFTTSNIDGTREKITVTSSAYKLAEYAGCGNREINSVVLMTSTLFAGTAQQRTATTLESVTFQSVVDYACNPYERAGRVGTVNHMNLHGMWYELTNNGSRYSQWSNAFTVPTAGAIVDFLGALTRSSILDSNDNVTYVVTSATSAQSAMSAYSATSAYSAYQTSSAYSATYATSATSAKSAFSAYKTSSAYSATYATSATSAKSAVSAYKTSSAYSATSATSATYAGRATSATHAASAFYLGVKGENQLNVASAEYATHAYGAIIADKVKYFGPFAVQVTDNNAHVGTVQGISYCVSNSHETTANKAGRIYVEGSEYVITAANGFLPDGSILFCHTSKKADGTWATDFKYYTNDNAPNNPPVEYSIPLGYYDRDENLAENKVTQIQHGNIYIPGDITSLYLNGLDGHGNAGYVLAISANGKHYWTSAAAGGTAGVTKITGGNYISVTNGGVGNVTVSFSGTIPSQGDVNLANFVGGEACAVGENGCIVVCSAGDASGPAGKVGTICPGYFIGMWNDFLEHNCNFQTTGAWNNSYTVPSAAAVIALVYACMNGGYVPPTFSGIQQS